MIFRTSGALKSTGCGLAGTILAPPRITSAAVIITVPRMGKRCLSEMAVSFSSASTRANWKSTRAASHWKITLAMPVDMGAMEGTEEGRFNAVRQMGRWKQGRQGRR